MRLTVLGKRVVANATILFSLISALLLSCAQPEEPLTVIAGKDLSVPDGVVYLTTMEKKALVIDSAFIHRGNFEFTFEKESEPFRACLLFKDSSERYVVVHFAGKWATLHATKEKRNVMMNRYHIEAFPSIIFTNKQGVEVKRIIGYGEDTVDQCKEFVEKYFSSENRFVDAITFGNI